MPSITSWTRLEPRTRSNTINTSLQARIHDPLWLLARQWQFGEFQGEDAGSPVEAKLEIQQSQLERYCTGSPDANCAQDYDSCLPLETKVERESALPTNETNFRLAAEAGLHFFRILGPDLTTEYRSDFLNQYALTPQLPQTMLDSGSKRFLCILAGRVPDGIKLYHELAPLRESGGLPSNELFSTKIHPTAEAEVRQAINDWLDWYERVFSAPKKDDAWLPERMEYAFSVSAPTLDNTGQPDELVITASEYYEGHLDWHSFEVDRKSAKLKTKGHSLVEKLFSIIPTPIRFRGMPAARFWEFEDSGVSFGNIEAAQEDLARLLLTEFALIYGNDHFIIPLELNVGSICRIETFKVKDTFGESHIIQPASAIDSGKTTWRMFCLSGEEHSLSEFLFLPPALGWSLQSAPIEEVHLVSDEMANLAWAVERIVESPMGRPLNRFEAYQEERRRKEAADPDSTIPRSGPLEYRFATSVPPYWIPLIPVQKQLGEVDIGLELGNFHIPAGTILNSKSSGSAQPLSLYEEEVPRDGARITRAYQYTRWVDGSTHLWIGRRKQIGHGEGSSGLRFDVVEPGQGMG